MASKDATELREELSDRNFHNWMKANLAIRFTREGIRDRVSSTINLFSEKILKKVRTKEQNESGFVCSLCTTENVLYCKTKRICAPTKWGHCQFHCSEVKQFRECPNGICTALRDEIKAFHKNTIPSWSNTRAERWCIYPWEMAKCYMPPDAYFGKDTIDDTDLNGLLSVIINHKDFKDAFDEDICLRVRTTVNAVRHDSGLLLTACELNDIADLLSRFLACSDLLKKDKNAVEAIQKIAKLKKTQLTVSTLDISVVLQDILKENSHICQNVSKQLQYALDTLNEERTQEHMSLNRVYTLLEEISEAIRTSKMDQRMPPSLQMQLQSIEERYLIIKREMQLDLLQFHRSHNSTLSLSPIFGEYDTDLVGFYVFPTLEIVEIRAPTFRGRFTEVRTSATSLRDVFFKGNQRYKEIYLTSEAGLGKTAFSKRLVVTWYYAHQVVETTTFSESDLQTMHDFDFVFLISLRDTNKIDCEIDEMIFHQVVNHLARSHRYSLDDVQEVLSREQCLIVLDGLDEWSHPDKKLSCSSEYIETPHRKAWGKCSVLTTTRSWKLSELRLKSSQKDNHVQIVGLDEKGVSELTSRTVKVLNDGEVRVPNYEIEKLSAELQHSSIQPFTGVPLVLTYLICLWRIKQPFGRSKCEIFSNLIGFLLFHAKEKYTEYDEGHSAYAKKFKIQMPKSVESNEYCRKYYSFLLKLGHLAFVTFFDESREKSFAFDIDVARKILTEQYIKFSLAIGLLTKDRNLESSISGKSRLSFQHQSFQEYLAALYMQSEHDFEANVGVVTRVCDSVESILTMSNVLIFLSGLCPQKASLLSKTLCNFAAASVVSKEYRRDIETWKYDTDYDKLMREYQDMQVACVEEYSKNFTRNDPPVDFHLEDYLIDADFQKKNSYFLNKLIEMNRKRMRSVKIRDVKEKEEFHQIVDLLVRNNVISLQKIDVKCELNEDDVERLLTGSKTTLECFTMKGGIWEAGLWKHKNITLSYKTVSVLSCAQHLKALYLRNIAMEHSEIEELVTHISGKPNVEQVGICFIECSDHNEKCTGVKFDLSMHSELMKLELGSAPFSEVQVDSSSLEVCYVGHFLNPSAISSFFNCLQNAPKLYELYCGCLTSSFDVDSLLNLLPQVRVSNIVWLFEMDIGDKKIRTSKYVRTLFMLKVRLSCKSLRDFLTEIENSRQNIRMGLFECDVRPEQEYDNLMEAVRQSNKFKVELDGKDDNNRTEFLFHTDQTFQ